MISCSPGGDPTLNDCRWDWAHHYHWHQTACQNMVTMLCHSFLVEFQAIACLRCKVEGTSVLCRDWVLLSQKLGVPLHSIVKSNPLSSFTFHSNFPFSSIYFILLHYFFHSVHHKLTFSQLLSTADGDEHTLSLPPTQFEHVVKFEKAWMLATNQRPASV